MTTGPDMPPSPRRVPEEPEQARVAIRFTIEGDLRYISHRDELRLLTRSLRRAGWPVAHSRGFNPQPRVLLPLPRSVGYASACEWAIVRLTERRAIEELHRDLAAALPPACRLLDVIALETRAKPHPRRALYAVELKPAHARHQPARIARLLAAQTLAIERSYGPGKPQRTVDIRPYIETVTIDGRVLSMWLAFSDQFSARPTEVLTALDLPAAEYRHRVRRVEVDWNLELAGAMAAPASTERKNVGQEESCCAQAQNRST